MAHRKLGKPSDQRKALIRNQVTNLIWYGKIETTLYRAKEVRAAAEKLITLAIREHAGTSEVTAQINNEKEQTITINVRKDTPAKLHARRQIMSYLYDLSEPLKKDETKSEYRDRTKKIKHPVVEKMFTEIAPKYQARKEKNNGIGGGYTRIVKMGPRRGDGAEMVVLELV